MNLIFVYGILRDRLEGNYVGEGTLQGYDMYDMGAFPAIVPGSGVIYGQLWKVQDDELAICDSIEGHPTFYKRTKVNIEDNFGEVHLAQVYVFQNSVNDCERVRHGMYPMRSIL